MPKITDTPRADTKLRPSTKARFVSLARPSRLHLRFCFGAVTGLLFALRCPQRPAGTQLGRTFFGVCLAVPQSPEEATQVLKSVRELNVGTVRLDFSPAQDVSDTLHFVDQLQRADVDVLLHLVPSIPEAAALDSQAGLDAWQKFLSETVSRFLGKVAAIEVGTTINRAKWSGTTLSGFLSAWEAAYQFARKYGLTLVGPNVTDFEPLYNAGVLSLLNERGRLPDVHSSNLFAERAVEPEAADRKVLGCALHKLHGYDLRKKTRLIASVAKRFGTAKNWSTCAFWTIPRARRLTGWAEEQVADYLLRYYVLCASVGDFERIYWGPLVSYREGLIDDGTEDRNNSDGRDIVAFYSGYSGSPQTWMPRPAYHALLHCIRELSGTRYVEAHRSGDGLEIHEFNGEPRACFVAWTRNGRLARTRDCFDGKSLDLMDEVRGVDGTLMNGVPAFIGDSPLYFFWKADGARPRVLSSAGCLQDVVGARLPKGFQYYDYRTRNWQGIVVAQSRAEARLLCDTLGPEAIRGREEKAVLRKSRNAIWSIEDPRDSGRRLVVKKPRRIACHKRLLDKWKPSKALRSWNGTSELMRRRIETPATVAYFESADPKKPLENWFVCDYVPGDKSVRGYFTKYAGGESSVDGYGFEDFANALVAFVLRMHATGIFFRDLSGGNILVNHGDEGELIFSLIDTARIRSTPFGVPKSQRIADLKRLVLKLNVEQQAEFMNAYLSRIKRRFTLRDQLSFRLFSMKIKLKRIKRRLRKRVHLLMKWFPYSEPRELL